MTICSLVILLRLLLINPGPQGNTNATPALNTRDGLLLGEYFQLAAVRRLLCQMYGLALNREKSARLTPGFAVVTSLRKSSHLWRCRRPNDENRLRSGMRSRTESRSKT